MEFATDPPETVFSILRFDNKYLIKQSFFNPFPEELIDKEQSRFEE